MKPVMIIILFMIGLTYSKILSSFQYYNTKENTEDAFCEIYYDTENYNVRYNCKNVKLSHIIILDKNDFMVAKTKELNTDETEGYAKTDKPNGIPVKISTYFYRASVSNKCKFGFEMVSERCENSEELEKQRQIRIQQEQEQRRIAKQQEYNKKLLLEEQKQEQYRLKIENELQRTIKEREENDKYNPYKKCIDYSKPNGLCDGDTLVIKNDKKEESGSSFFVGVLIILAIAYTMYQVSN